MLDELLPDEKSDAERDLAPSVDIPDESDVDHRLRRQFWLLVLVFNVAILAASVGAMLAVFRGQWDTGGSLLAAGAILSIYGFYKYRVYADADSTDTTGESAEEHHTGTDSPGESDTTADPSSAGDTDSESGSVADLDAQSRTEDHRG